jgi:hypothetical protein
MIINDIIGTWKVQFKSFDGKVNEFAGVDSSNPFIKIEINGMQNRIYAANPATLQYP